MWLRPGDLVMVAKNGDVVLSRGLYVTTIPGFRDYPELAGVIFDNAGGLIEWIDHNDVKTVIKPPQVQPVRQTEQINLF